VTEHKVNALDEAKKAIHEPINSVSTIEVKENATTTVGEVKKVVTSDPNAFF